MLNVEGQAPFDSSPPLVHLQWHAEDGMVPIEGQGEPAPALGGQGESPEVESYFYQPPENMLDREYGKGFKSKEDLDKAWTKSFQMRSDYSKKTAEVAQTRKAIEQERAEHEKQKKEFAEWERKIRDEFKTYDQLIRNNPPIHKYLQSKLKGSNGINQESIEQLIEEKYGTKFKKIEEWESKQLAEEQKREAAEALKLMYEDFDIEPVQKYYDELVGGNLQSLMEMLYYANKGRSINPLDVERQMTEKLQKKQAGKLVSSEGTKAESSPKAYKSIEEAQAAAIRSLKKK